MAFIQACGSDSGMGSCSCQRFEAQKPKETLSDLRVLDAQVGILVVHGFPLLLRPFVRKVQHLTAEDIPRFNFNSCQESSKTNFKNIWHAQGGCAIPRVRCLAKLPVLAPQLCGDGLLTLQGLNNEKDETSLSPLCSKLLASVPAGLLELPLLVEGGGFLVFQGLALLGVC